MLNTDWAQVEIIDLINDGSGLAFGIIGGRSTGVVVKTILPGGVADRDGRLQSGDHILQIGEVNLRGLGSEQVASVLRQCGVYVRMVVARPVESTAIEIKSLNNRAPIVPTKILGDPVELDKYLIENGYLGTCTSNSSSISRPIVYNRQNTISDMVEVIRNPISISKSHTRKTGPTSSSTTVQKNNSKSQDLPETETFTIELEKDDLGLGITVAGYVCEKEGISGIFVKSITKGSAADAKQTIEVNDRIIEVNGVSVIGQTNHQAVEFLKNTGAMVKLKFERYLRGPKYEQLQQAIKANEYQPNLSSPRPSPTPPPPPPPPSSTVSFQPKVPLSNVQMSYLATEPEMESQTSIDLDSAVIFDCNGPEDEEKEIVIDGKKSQQFSISCHQDIYDKWKNQFDKDVQIVIADMHKDESTGLGISLEGTVDVEDGKEVRPHHYIRNILPGGPVGINGTLKSGDELLEVNGIKLLGMNHFEVVATLKQLPDAVNLVCARYPAPMRIIDTSQHPEAFKARKIICESLQTLIQSAEQNRLVKAKSESSIASSLSSEACTTSKSRSLELVTGLPMWSDEATTIELIKGDHGLGFSILDYQDPLNPQETVIVIRSLVPGGVAQTDGRLVPGDRLLAVNDVNVARATLDSAVQVLKRANKGVIKITVAKPLNGKDTISDANQDSEDQTCLDDFQECIEEFQDLINVPILFEDDRSFNYSPSTSQVEDLGEKKFQMYSNRVTNVDLLENNYLNIKELTRDSIGDSDIDISFKSTNDNFLDQRNSDCDNNQLFLKKQLQGNVEKNDGLTQSEKPSLSDKDDYDTGMDESLSADNVRIEKIDNDKLNLELEEITPTNSKVDINNANVFVDTVNTKISPNLSVKMNHSSYKKQHLYLSSKLDHFATYSNQQQCEAMCESDEFFLVEYPTSPTDSVNKSTSETNVFSQTLNQPLVNKLTFKLREYYNDYENCLDAYKDLTVYEKIQEELSDSQIFGEIFLPFKCRSAPDILDHSFITMTYDRDPDINRRKSVFMAHNNDVSYIKNSCEMTVIRQIEPDYENMKGQENNTLHKHWGSSHMVKVFREPGENLGISIVGGKVDVQPSNEHQQQRSEKLLGIFVKNVTSNSPAGKTGKFNTGDRILEVSGIDLREATHEKAVEAIRNSPNPVVLIIQSLIPWVNNPGGEFQENDKNVIESSEKCQTSATFSNNNKTLSKDESLDIEEEEEEEEAEAETEEQVAEKVEENANDNMPTPKGVDTKPAVEIAEEHTELPALQVHSTESDKFQEPENVANVKKDLKDTPPVSDESSSEADDDDEVNAIEMEGRTVSSKGYQIDRASAANVKRNKDEAAADKEEEDDFGYTINKVKKKYGNLGHTVLMVQLERTSSGLGISLAGHRDRSCMAVFVCGLNPNGAAYRSGSIQIGDEILEVNGVVLHGRCHLNASAIIKSLSGPVFKVIILRRKTAIDDIAVKPITQFPISLQDEISEEHFSAQYNNVRTVTIKKTNQSLGIMIIEGKHAEVGQGIFISDIQEGSLANKAGLEIGEMILAVNKDSLVGSNYDTAANLLKRTEGLVSLIVSNPGKKDPSKIPASSSNQTESKLNANLKTSNLPSRPTTPVPEVPVDPTTCPVTPGYQTTIEIATNNESLGIFFIGGKDTTTNDGIILHELYPGGAAEKDGRLQPGDQILEVNGISLRDCSHTTASQALRQTLPKMKITVFRPANLEYIPIEVEMMKKAGKGLGLSVVGRKSGKGVYIADIVPGGQAESDGKISKGDLLISINGQNLENVTSEEAGAILKTAMGARELFHFIAGFKCLFDVSAFEIGN